MDRGGERQNSVIICLRGGQGRRTPEQSNYMFEGWTGRRTPEQCNHMSEGLTGEENARTV